MAAASSPPGLLDALRSAGFTLTIAAGPGGATLRVWPATRLTAPQRAALRAHKAALLELLRLEAAEAAARRARPPRPPARPGRHAAGRGVVVGAPGPGGGGRTGRATPAACSAPCTASAAWGRAWRARPGARCGSWRGPSPPPSGAPSASAWLAPHRAAVLELLRAVAAAWQDARRRPGGRRRDDAGRPARLARRAALSGPEVEALDALPIVDLRAFLAERPAGAGRRPRRATRRGGTAPAEDGRDPARRGAPGRSPRQPETGAPDARRPRGRRPPVPRLRPGRGPVAPHRLLLGALPARAAYLARKHRRRGTAGRQDGGRKSRGTTR